MSSLEHDQARFSALEQRLHDILQQTEQNLAIRQHSPLPSVLEAHASRPKSPLQTWGFYSTPQPLASPTLSQMYTPTPMSPSPSPYPAAEEIRHRASSVPIRAFHDQKDSSGDAFVKRTATEDDVQGTTPMRILSPPPDSLAPPSTQGDAQHSTQGDSTAGHTFSSNVHRTLINLEQRVGHSVAVDGFYNEGG